MSVDPDLVDRLAGAAVGTVRDAELDLLARVARSLARGVDAPGWAQRQLAEVTTLRRGWEGAIAPYLSTARTQVGNAVLDAGKAGEQLALESLRAVLTGRGRRPAVSGLPGLGPVVALAEEVAGAVASTRWGVLRSTEDLFRRAVAETAGRVLLATQTRRGVAQQVLDRLASRGVDGFVDQSGRRWELASYVEMATRTAAQRAMTHAHSAALQANGVDLVIVSDAPQECRLCRPWENRVLSLSGGGRHVLTLPSAVDPGRLVQVEVSGSLDEARRAGLYHPNCRHSHSAYLPGLTKPARPRPADPQGDADRQHLRYLERQLRAAKRREAVALDDAARARARAGVRARQAAIREHVASTTAKRQPPRERIGVAR